MRLKHLRNIDLNLLVILSALLEERGVTAAAQAIGLSQPATSRALGRLRDLLGDDLLVRTSTGTKLTPRAESLKPELQLILQNLTSLLESDEFDPTSTDMVFNIAVNDYAGSVVLPRILRSFRDQSLLPGLSIHPIDMSTIKDIEAGTIDLAIGNFQDAPDSFFRQVLFEDKIVCMLRADHPALKGKFTIKKFTTLPHLFVSQETNRKGIVDEALKNQGHTRHISARIPYFSAAPSILLNSDMILSLPNRLALELGNSGQFRIIPPPLKIPTLSVAQLWHRQLNTTNAHQWLRNTIMQSISLF